MLVIQSAADVRALPKAPGYVEDALMRMFGMGDLLCGNGIDFEAIAEAGYDAILMYENPETHYALYGWDCDSLLVLNPGVVEELPMGEIDTGTDMKSLKDLDGSFSTTEADEAGRYDDIEDAYGGWDDVC